jgi:1-acyl-sn-glycerol-3-phosphate acyltransferase
MMPDVTPDEPDTAPDAVPSGAVPTADAHQVPPEGPVASGGSRPTIQKHLADRRVFIPEGHRRGEVMTRGQKVMYALTWFVATSIARTYFRTKVWGKENVPRSGAFIISPVHRSNLDTPLLALVTTRRMRYMGKESLWKRKWSAWYFTAAGGFPVERATADRDALNACLEVLERGEPLVLFPEGTRQSGPVVTEMFDGAAWLASRVQCPILPVGIGGSERAMSKGSKFPRPTRMTLVVGKPIHPAPHTGKGRVSRRSVKELTAALRASLQTLFDEAQERAGSPNRT